MCTYSHTEQYNLLPAVEHILHSAYTYYNLVYINPPSGWKDVLVLQENAWVNMNLCTIIQLPVCFYALTGCTCPLLSQIWI